MVCVLKKMGANTMYRVCLPTYKKRLAGKQEWIPVNTKKLQDHEKKVKNFECVWWGILILFSSENWFWELIEWLQVGLCRSVTNVVSEWDVYESKLHTFYKAFHVVPQKCFSVTAFFCFHIIPSEFVIPFLMSDKHFDDMSWMNS